LVNHAGGVGGWLSASATKSYALEEPLEVKKGKGNWSRKGRHKRGSMTGQDEITGEGSFDLSLEKGRVLFVTEEKGSVGKRSKTDGTS